MGINSTEVSYGFGQLGSAYTDKAVEVIPPKDHVIIGIQFLDQNTPTVMTPERLDEGGPGACGSAVSNATHAAHTDITLTNPPSDTSLIRKGQYVMVVAPDATENGSTALAYDTAQTPFPVYNGAHKAGVRVVEWDGVSKVKLDTAITTSSEALIFIDETHGAGGITAADQAFPKGITIYGRWTAFKGEADKGVICYFGK